MDSFSFKNKADLHIKEYLQLQIINILNLKYSHGVILIQ